MCQYIIYLSHLFLDKQLWLESQFWLVHSFCMGGEARRYLQSSMRCVCVCVCVHEELCVLAYQFPDCSTSICGSSGREASRRCGDLVWVNRPPSQLPALLYKHLCGLSGWAREDCETVLCICVDTRYQTKKPARWPLSPVCGWGVVCVFVCLCVCVCVCDVWYVRCVRFWCDPYWFRSL